MSSSGDSVPRKKEERPDIWILVAGCVFGALTLLYLMIFPIVTLLTEKRLYCGDTWLISLVFGLGVGLSSAFLGGYAAAQGSIRIPILGDNPLATSIAGGIAFLVVGVGVAYLVTSSSCTNPQQRLVRPSFGEWHYTPKARKFSFRLERDLTAPAEMFVPEKESDNYDIYVAVRAKRENDPWVGAYEIVVGPYKYSTGGLVEKLLTDQQLSALGECVQMIAFGLKLGQKPSIPFSIEGNRTQRFQWAGACGKGKS
jgi:hypothetical protein